MHIATAWCHKSASNEILKSLDGQCSLPLVDGSSYSLKPTRSAAPVATSIRAVVSTGNERNLRSRSAAGPRGGD